MMNNLFSIFDPSTMFHAPLNWLSLLVFSIIISSKFINNKWATISSLIAHKINNEMKIILNNTTHKINIIMMMSLFVIISLNNLISLMPYVFNITSSMSVNLTISLSLWMGMIFFAIKKFSKSLLAHLVPLGTPTPLMPLMVIIELTSSLIRPMTLAVRLTTNMIAGHLMMSLIGSMMEINLIKLIIIVPQILLILMELAVAAIQAYVFSILMTLYISEINN